MLAPSHSESLFQRPCHYVVVPGFLNSYFSLYYFIFSLPQRYNSRHLWSACLDFIYRGLPPLPATCEPLIACSYHSILTSWTLPHKDLQDPQSWEGGLTLNSTTSGKVSELLLLRIPSCPDPLFLASGFNNVLGFCVAPENHSNQFPLWWSQFEMVTCTQGSSLSHTVSLYILLHTGCLSNRHPIINTILLNSTHTIILPPVKGRHNQIQTKVALAIFHFFYIIFPSYFIARNFH